MQGRNTNRHKVDLAGLQALCAANYSAINHLLPALRGGQVQCAVAACDIHVDIRERGPYTTLLDMEQCGADLSAATPAPQFQVRVYHDARMAEVVACQGHRQIKPRYDYPNARMYQKDEKYQLNRFFGEWLQRCLASGRAAQGSSALLS